MTSGPPAEPSSTRHLVAGWSRSRLKSEPGLILDVGSGSFPNPAADILCDGEIEDSVHRHGRRLVVDGRPFVVARVEALPFRDRAFGFVIASHIAEHVDDPDGFCYELGRVATAGYVETPSPLADALLHEDYHVWRVGNRRGVLTFTAKGPRPPRRAAAADWFYRVFYAGRSDCARPTARLPEGLAGKAVTAGLRVIGGLLNRSGLLHTRYVFGPDNPFAHRVER